MARIFFALHLRHELQSKLSAVQKVIPVPQNAVKWVEEKNLHLTLQFIGDVDGHTLETILKGARLAAWNIQPFSIEIARIGSFPTPKQPRVIWAGVTAGAEELAGLASVLAKEIGIRPDKPFSPHITLGRIRDGHSCDLSGYVHINSSFVAGTMQVDRFACVSSVLTSGGPVYKNKAEFHLGKYFSDRQDFIG
jgi:RNA 2',3'-cyclic 3'-phosphodiesterase